MAEGRDDDALAGGHVDGDGDEAACDDDGQVKRRQWLVLIFSQMH